MSVSHVEEVETATLEELFDFIDCCDECLQTNNGDGNNALLISTSPCPQHAQPHSDITDDAKKTPKRRRKRIGWSSSTGLQRRKRAELEFLRQHVQDLEAYVHQLNLPPTLPNFNLMKSDIRMEEFATLQLEKRLRSEEVNRVLKAIMANQLDKHNELRIVLGDSNNYKKDD
ncbi:hypothetical protein PHMEG_00022788 [Phytophthora megakarya]|uniref:Uncharacterized protein n=1 Tax=Phytophthora megakarya TaxID=4795 RepID=A0A225VKW5_9STRA|nr:hypothetical protein PHMEG_00022788 [Phytophthora megakarya]